MVTEDVGRLADEQLTVKLGIGREIKLLPEQLHDGESVLRLAKANHGGKSGLLAVTDERLVWFHAGMVGRSLVDQRLERVSCVSAKKGMVSASLVVNAGGDEWTLSNVVPKDAVDEIASTIRAQAARMHGGATPAAAPVDHADRLRRLVELRDSGVISDAEYEAKRAEIVAEL